MPFFSLFYRYIIRDVVRSPLRAALCLAGIALGVGAVVAVQLANERAVGSFNDSLTILSGKADLQINANGLPLDENILGELSWLWDFGSMSASVEGRARIEGIRTDGGEPEPVYVFGVDLLSDGAFRDYIVQDQRDLAADISREEFIDILLDPDRVVIAEALAIRANLRKGSILPVLIGDSRRSLVVGSILRNEGLGRAFAGNVLFMDIAAAQLAFRKVGQIDRIDIRVRDLAQIAELESKIRSQLPGNALVYRPDASTRNEKLLRAFRYNLTALSYISLMVGIILVYNTLMIAVVRRRREIAVLRALGTSRRIVAALFLSEAFALGLLGSVLGVFVGRLLASVSGELVSQTIQDLYTGFFTMTDTPGPEIRLFLKAVAGGTLLAVASALGPALRATTVSPVVVLREGSLGSMSVRAFRMSSIAGSMLLAAGGAMSFGPPIAGFPFLGYASALFLIIGVGLLMPWSARMLVELLAWPLCLVSPVVGRLAVQSMRSGIRRISVAVFSLAIAVAMLVSVATMVSSFRDTVQLWVDQTLKADLYIRPAASAANEWTSTFDPRSLDQLSSLPSIAALDRFRGLELDFNGVPVVLAAGEFEVLREHGRLLFPDGRTTMAIADRMIDQERVIVSEPLSIKQGVRAGDFIPIPTATGTKRFQVEALFYDYSNDRGLIVMDRATYLRNFGDSSVTNVAVYLKPGEDPVESRDAIAQLLPDAQLRILANADIKKQVLRVFDETFRITYALEAIATIVAVLGIANTLAALILERRAEFAVLRFLGTSRVRLRQVVLTESAATGLIGIAVGTALGLALSLILVYVINRQSFGWTIQFGVPAGFLLRSLAVILGSTIAAGIYPAEMVRRLDPIESIRAE